MLLIFTPFHRRNHRGLGISGTSGSVFSSAQPGMMVELALALALIVWINAEPGIVRVLAYNTILIDRHFHRSVQRQSPYGLMATTCSWTI